MSNPNPSDADGRHHRHHQTPALRGLDIERVEQGGRSGIALSDRLGVTKEPIFIPDGLLPLVGRMDGTRTLAEIAEEAVGDGEEMPAGFLENLVAQLDERLALHGPRFQAAVRTEADEFLASGVRPCRHAGSAGYPQDPAALREALTGIVGSPEPRGPAPKGVVAPHIDLARGRDGYTQAYGWLAEHEPADLYVIFGTGHGGPASPVTGLELDWETPLGTVSTDRDFVRRVHRELGAPEPADLLLHRDEHSMEFQVLFLKHLLGERPFAVACFLTGYLPSDGGDPGEEEYMQRLLTVFRETTAASGRRVCFIAGADLAHLGPFFGDDPPVDEPRLERLRTEELSRLQPLLEGQPGAFHRGVEGDGNRDRVCGSSPIYLAAALCGGPGELLHYGQAPAPDGSQVVSYCAVGFTG